MIMLATIIFDADGIDPATLIIAACVTICALLVLLTLVLVGFVDRDRVRIDPHEAAFGDVPGFSREQLLRFQADSQPVYLPPVLDFRSSSEDVALRSKRAGAADHIPSGGAGVSRPGDRRDN